MKGASYLSDEPMLDLKFSIGGSSERALPVFTIGGSCSTLSLAYESRTGFIAHSSSTLHSAGFGIGERACRIYRNDMLSQHTIAVLSVADEADW
jgi:hypothetical protein